MGPRADHVVAKYCRHCGRFVKGTNAHFTKGHTNRNRWAYKPPDSGAPAPAPAPAAGSANLALTTLREGLDPNSIPVVDTLAGSVSSGVRWSDQVPVPAGYAPVQFNQANYDLQPGLNLGRMEGDDKDGWSLLNILGLNM